MAKKDPDTLLRRENFRTYCRARGWERPDGRGWYASQVAAAIGKPVNKASDLLNGNGSFGSTIAREIEDALGLEKGYLDDMADAHGFEDVKRLDVKVAAGHGAIPHREEKLGSLKFRIDFLRSIGASADNGVIVSVRGHSMDPTIPDGATLLVNKSNREPRNNQIYVFWRRDEGLVVKRVVRVADQWLARSDNDDRVSYPDFPFKEDEDLIGRAVWMGVKL